MGYAQRTSLSPGGMFIDAGATGRSGDMQDTIQLAKIVTGDSSAIIVQAQSSNHSIIERTRWQEACGPGKGEGQSRDSVAGRSPGMDHVASSCRNPCTFFCLDLELPLDIYMQRIDFRVDKYPCRDETAGSDP